ncbi:MAG: Type IV fimbrial assembly protein PilC [Brockia lithotrophica]|uniref:Type IV fimbrial assembly protein PilC n=1 Tax=Brockia lithotrophica TaxID=933949 RepID=A0A2T5GAQ7_9BACL|nr:MAG: Type IV fimbrial assembly protein PilC [Brockia lithotrophica]
MATYRYVLLDRTGRRLKGTHEAGDVRTAYGELSRQGTVLALEEYAPSFLTQEIVLSSPLSGRDFVLFVRQFAILIDAGVPMVRAFTLLAQQARNARAREVFLGVVDKLREGVSLSDALAHYPRVFPGFFVAMVRAGELSGELSRTLDEAAAFYERSFTLRQRLAGAVAYPLFLLVFSVLVVIFLLTFVLPRFTSLFAQMNVSLPWITRVVLAVAGFFGSYWWAVVAALVAFVLLFAAAGKGFRDRLLLALPGIGGAVRVGAYALLARTLAVFYAAGAPLLDALGAAKDVIGNAALGQELEEVRARLREGLSLSQALAEGGTFPPLLVQTVAVGEATGSLDAVLEKLAEFYQMDLEQALQRLERSLEPILVLAMAVVVGFLILSIILPLLTLYQNVR